MQGREGVGKDVIRNAPALGNPFALVECPVDAEVDSALAVFLFGRCQLSDESKISLRLIFQNPLIRSNPWT